MSFVIEPINQHSVIVRIGTSLDFRNADVRMHARDHHLRSQRRDADFLHHRGREPRLRLTSNKLRAYTMAADMDEKVLKAIIVVCVVIIVVLVLSLI